MLYQPRLEIVPSDKGWQFYPVLLNPPLPATSRVGFSRPAMLVGQGWGKNLDPHHRVGWGGNGFRLFRPASPLPPPPRPALLRVIIVNCSYPKTLLFIQTYQYLLILFYLMWFSIFILLYVVGAFFGRIRLPPAVMGWAASCDDRP